jgi:mono/diheme cytochrome c family protein
MRWLLAALVFAFPLSGKVTFVRQVKPILETHCVRCHGDDRAMKHFRVDRREWALRGITPGNPDDSILYLAPKSGFMPPKPDQLSPAELDTLRKWIAEGAHWPKNVVLIYTPKR